MSEIKPNGGTPPPPQQFPFLIFVAFHWQVGLRQGHGHEVIGVSRPPISKQQMNDVAAAIGNMRSKLEATDPEYIPEGAHVTLASCPQVVAQAQKPQPVVLPKGFDPRGGPRR